MSHPKYLVKLIESIINSELSEVAVSPDVAASKELALLVYEKGPTRNLILYEMNPVKIYGMISTRYKQNCAANEVGESAAEQGYGPLMYHAAMSLGNHPFLMPDRFMVSDEAAGIWRKFFDRQDVDKVLLPKDCQYTRTDPEFRFLNYKFALKSPMDFSKLIKAHENNIKKSELYNKTPQDFFDVIHEKGLMFFGDKYKD
jgi:hypothetical protein